MSESKPQDLLGGLPVQEFVVLVAKIVDTAIILATCEREAAEKYEFFDNLSDDDTAIWAMTRDEFDELMASSEAPYKSEPALDLVTEQL